MRRALIKDYVREIRNTLNRFFAILVIIAIGVSFFVGIRATGPDMRDSADQYLDETQLMDIKVMSNYGISEEDLQYMRDIDDVSVAVGSYTTDMLLGDDRGFNMKIISVPEQTDEYNAEYINRFHLVEGRLPEKSGEILIDNWRRDLYPIEVGEVITLDTGRSDMPVEDYLKINQFTVVGVASTPLYLSYEKGPSTVGDGTAVIFGAIMEEDFNFSAYTEAYIRIKGTETLSSFSNEYKDSVAMAQTHIEEALAERENDKTEEIKEEIKSELADDLDLDNDDDEEEDDPDDGIGDNPYDNEWDNEEEGSSLDLDQLRRDIEDAEEELRQQWDEFDEKFAAAKLDLDNAQEQLDEAEAAYNKSLGEWNSSKAELDTKKQELNDARSQIATGEAQVSDAKAMAVSMDKLAGSRSALSEQEVNTLVNGLQATNPEMAGLVSGYMQGTVTKSEYRGGIATYKTGIDTQEKEIAQKKKDVDNYQKEIDEKQGPLDSAKVQLDEQEQNIIQLRNYVEEGQPAYEEERRDALEQLNEKEREIAEKKEKLEDAEGTMESLEDAVFYVYDRDINPGYSSYEENSDRITAVAQIFPVFFFFVAALVCLTTMTRMVEEQRTQIGILKAIGYSPMQIIGKYLLYSALAGILGSVVALFVGFNLFPSILIDVYAIMYFIPYKLLPMRLGSSIISIIVALMCTMVTAFFACKTELIEQAAVLMRPKAPKGGKRILIERIGFLWNRLSYKLKVTARNIFRYKMRMVMTNFGIAGCTALMVTAWGLQDSISDIVKLQFEEINIYHIMSSVNMNADQEALDVFENLLETHESIDSSIYAMQEYVDIIGEKTINVNMVVPEEPEEFSNFIYLRDADTKEHIPLDNGSIVVTKKLAKLLDLEKGSELIIKDGKGIEYMAIVSDVAENYALHFIYMTPQMYNNIFAKEPEYNTVTINLTETSSEEQQAAQEEEIGWELTNQDCIMTSTFNSKTADNFDDTMASFNVVVYVLIISAAVLAFVVLYNLTNINVSERIRELATIKVLGFQDGEVTSYIYRENFFLTLMGIVVGIFVGILLHRYVVETAEIDNALFIRQIKLVSYFLAAGFTIMYSVLVNFVMHFKLKRLDMVEALKGVE